MGVPRYTTPTFSLTFTEASLDFTQASHVYVTFTSGLDVLTKSDSELSIEPKVINIRLTQEETAAFGQGMVDIQVNWTIAGNRFASEIAKVDMSRQLMERVVE